MSIIDLAPDRLTTFVLQAPADVQVDQITSIAAANGKLLLGGGRVLRSGASEATLEMRDIGIEAAEPRFNLEARVAASESYTTAVAMDHTSGGATLVWQARRAGDCSAALHRLDYAGSTFIERYSIHLPDPAPLPACWSISMITPTGPLPRDPPGARGLLLTGPCGDSPWGPFNMCTYRVLDEGSRLALDTSFADDGLLRYDGGGEDMYPLHQVVDVYGNVYAALTDTAAGPGQKGRVARFRSDGSLDARFGTAGVITMPGARSTAFGLAFAADGMLLVAGSADGESGVRPTMLFVDPRTGTLAMARLELSATEAEYIGASYNAVLALPATGALAVGGIWMSTRHQHALIVRLVGDGAVE